MNCTGEPKRRRGTERALRLSLIALLVLTAGGCVSRSAMQRMQDQLDYLEASQRRMERDMIHLDSLTELAAGESRRTRAEVTTTLGEFQDEGRALRESIDELRRSVERRSPQVVYRPSVAPDTASANAVDDEFVDTPPDIDPSQLYENAFLDVRKGNYELAIDQFRDILIYFGDTEYAPNARYWIGECWYSLAGTTTANEDENEDLNFYDSAVVEFEYLVANHPESDRVPTALYKLGRCYEELGRTRRARRYYERVRDEFPKSLEAKPAEGRLENLE